MKTYSYFLLALIFIFSTASFANTIDPTNANTLQPTTVTSQDTQKKLTTILDDLKNQRNNAAHQELQAIASQQAQASSQDKAQYFLLEAYLKLNLDQPGTALELLLNPGNQFKQLSDDQYQLYQRLLASAYLRTNHILNSELVLLKQNANNKQQFITIFRTLQNLPNTTIEQADKAESDPMIKAWLDLVIIAQNDADQPTNLVNDIQNWEMNHPDHPANQLIPSPELLQRANQFYLPQKIALLLPLSGPFSAMSEAVEHGFIAGFYSSAHLFSVKPDIIIFDTTQPDARTAYRKAVKAGAELIIGPLTKEEVSDVDDINTQIPTITLNYTHDTPSAATMMEFGLSPEQSAKQAADAAWEHGVSKTLSFTPDSSWASSVLNAFSTELAALGGQVIDGNTYSNNTITDPVTALLHIDQSNERADPIKKLSGVTFSFQPTPRQDANGIFLLGNNSIAREFKPLINYYFNKPLPIFSTSLLHTLNTKPGLNRDLDGIYFLDTPWMIEQTPRFDTLRQHLMQHWKISYKAHPRMYGIGVDAFLLGMSFYRFNILPNFAIEGVSGNLFYNANQHVWVSLTLAQFQNGKPVAL